MQSQSRTEYGRVVTLNMALPPVKNQMCVKYQRRPHPAQHGAPRFKNGDSTRVCVLDLSLPGGQDHFFKAISDLAALGSFSPEAAMEISRKFDTNFVAPL